MRKLRLTAVAIALLTASTAQAQDSAACALPGELVGEDAVGDHTLAPTGLGFADIHTLHMAEPDGGPNLVFTYKMADLAELPPNTGWIIRFLTDVTPAGEEQFVAMVTDPAGSPHFVYGMAVPADPAGQAGLLFEPAGALEAASDAKADGTISLVVNKAAMPGLSPGAAVFSMIPLVHRITPTDGSQPFVYGFRSLGAAQLSYDDGPDGFYELVQEDACAGKSGVLGLGALSPLTLLALGGLALSGLRRRLR